MNVEKAVENFGLVLSLGGIGVVIWAVWGWNDIAGKILLGVVLTLIGAMLGADASNKHKVRDAEERSKRDHERRQQREVR